MKDINNFTSQNRYLYIPSKINPRVVLAIDNKQMKNNSFKLYNPFSTKAKIFKSILKNLCDVSFLCNKISEKQDNSKFVKYLNNVFDKNFISSIYIATEKDKVVLQLQTDNKIFGYVKFPLSNIGVKRVLNEKKGIGIFNSLKVCEKYLKFDYYQNIPFLVLTPVDGKYLNYDKKSILDLLKKFERKESYKLVNHPRVLNILYELKNEKKLLSIILNIINSSAKEYKLVYEHGDFAPWNIIEKNNKLIPFDFEYFEEQGLEWMDFIKYYYQIGKLLKKYNNKNLIDYILNQMDVKEKEIIFKIFLFKEIVMKRKENKSFEDEINLLKIMGVL